MGYLHSQFHCAATMWLHITFHAVVHMTCLGLTEISCCIACQTSSGLRPWRHATLRRSPETLSQSSRWQDAETDTILIRDETKRLQKTNAIVFSTQLIGQQIHYFTKILPATLYQFLLHESNVQRFQRFQAALSLTSDLQCPRLHGPGLDLDNRAATENSADLLRPWHV